MQIVTSILLRIGLSKLKLTVVIILLGNITPAYKWDHYQQQMNKEQMMINSTIALSTNGERNTLQIEGSRLVDKIVEEQKLNIFETYNQ